jgi:hypothetical protein
MPVAAFNVARFVDDTVQTFLTQLDGLGVSYEDGLLIACELANDLANEIEYAAQDREEV